jgi:hypothetical protein
MSVILAIDTFVTHRPVVKCKQPQQWISNLYVGNITFLEKSHVGLISS